MQLENWNDQKRTVVEFNAVLAHNKSSITSSNAPPQASLQEPWRKTHKESGGQRGPVRALTEGTRSESELGHRVGEVGHPAWNEPNGTENVSSV